MPNWCFNSLAFCSDRRDPIEKLHDIYQDFYSHGGRDVVDFFKAQGYPIDKQVNTDRRDFFGWVSKVLIEDDGLYYFYIDVESAWSPHLDQFFIHVYDLFKGEVKIKYYSEECGCEIFETNDRERTIFKSTYWLQVSSEQHSENDYPESKEELVKSLNEGYGLSLTEDMSIEDMAKAVKDSLLKEDPYANCTITEIEFVDYYDDEYLKKEEPF